MNDGKGPIPKRLLGSSGIAVTAIGLGCMSLSGTYGTSRDEDGIAVIHRAIELGIDFLDTADVYGVGKNEELVGRAIREPPREGHPRNQVRQCAQQRWRLIGVDGRPAYVRRCCEASLKRLGVDTIDLYYQHRVDPKTPIEDTVGAMAELVKEGKVRFLGLSEAAPDTIRRAHKVHPITALQTEYSLWSREPEEEILPTCASSASASSPTARLGAASSPADQDPWTIWSRATIAGTRHASGRTNFQKNLDLVATISAIAAAKRAPRLSSRSPGCSRGATTSCRSRARSGATWRRTSARSRCH